MNVTRTSMATGITRTLDLPVTEEQLRRWEEGELAQRVFPHLSEDAREFIMTGITKEEWDEFMPTEED